MSDDKKSDLVQLTALWLNTSPGGEQYLGGYLGDAKIMVFKNKFKQEGSKEPDYRVYLAPGEKKPKPAITPQDGVEKFK